MVIRAKPNKTHWNYFLSLERDLEVLSRYVEFATANEETFSIELARLLFAAASEVDVLAKLICTQLEPRRKPNSISAYKPILLAGIPSLPTMTVYIPRYGLEFEPWSNWAGTSSPDWWVAYNKVKHQRDAHFAKATLKNAWNAVGGLLILVTYYYSRELTTTPNTPLSLKGTTHLLEPAPTLVRLDAAHYHEIVVF